MSATSAIEVQPNREIRTVRFDSLNTLATKPVNFENLRKNAKSISDLRLQRTPGR
jgi:hypothetical protein